MNTSNFCYSSNEYRGFPLCCYVRNILIEEFKYLDHTLRMSTAVLFYEEVTIFLYR